MTVTELSSSIRSFDKLFIGGRWETPVTSDVIEVISPITEEVICTVPAASNADMDKAVAAARKTFDSGIWSDLSVAERAAHLRRVGEEVQARIPEMADMFTAEVGTPHALGVMFHEMAVGCWVRAAELLETFPMTKELSWEDGGGTVVREPIGVVAAIIPWNGPVANCSLKIAPAIAAGCTIVLKPAWEGPTTTLLLAEAIEAAGIPEGVVSILPGGREVGEYLVTHPGIDKVSFTGSTVTGKHIMKLCSDNLTRITLELGGKSAGILTEDVDLDEALPVLLAGGVGHSGQVCAAITRILAPRSRYQEVCDGIVKHLEAMKTGDPNDSETNLGPLVAERQRKRVLDYIELGKSEGAKVATGGGRPADLEKGWYVEPTLLVDVDNSMRVAREEIFGPVLVAIPYDDIDDAVRIANDSEFGLSGAVFTADAEKGREIAARMRTGQVFVNSVGVCLQGPFGGYKQSGIGREGGHEGFEAFLETKMLIG